MAKSLLTKLGTLALIGYVAWLGWEQLGPRKPEIGPMRRQAADQSVSDVVEDLRKHRGEIGTVVLVHFEGDPSDYFTDRLRSVLEQRGTLNLCDQSLTEKLRDRLTLRQPTASTADAALKIARRRGSSGVLYGRLNKYESTIEETVLEVEYALVSAETGETIHAAVYEWEATSLDQPLVEEEPIAKRAPWFKRGLGWLVLVLLLPVFTIGFIRTMVARRSNGINAFMLAIYTGANIILAYLLVGASLTDFWSVFFFVLANVAGFIYNVRIMTFALKLESD